MNHPIIFFEGNYSENDINKTIKKYKLTVIDNYEFQIKELARIMNPNKSDKEKKLKFYSSFIEKQTEGNTLVKGDWIYFPWTNVFLHQVKKEDYLKILTDRNKGFIDDYVQQEALKKNICIAGLSTGASIAVSLVHSGIGQKFILSDFDYVETSDLNRTIYDISDIGTNKVVALSRKMYQINPYIQIKGYTEGFLKDNTDIILSKNKIDIFFDEASMLTPGIFIRKYAKNHSIPVITCGNLGFGSYIAIERYDINKHQKMYFGIDQNELNRYLENQDYDGLEKSSLSLMSTERIPVKTLDIVENKNSIFTESPQLYSALSLNSSFVIYLLLKIIKGEKTKKEYFLQYSLI